MSSLQIGPTVADRHVLLVEDDPGTAELVRRTLEHSGYLVKIAPGVLAGMKELCGAESDDYAVLLLDYNLPDGEPWQLADAAQARVPEVPVVFVTAASDEKVAIEAVRRGFADYVKKVSGFWDELPAVLERVARLSRLKVQLDESSALMRAVVEHSSDLVTVADGEGKLVYVSPVCAAVLGWSPEELLGRQWMEILAAEDREAIGKALLDPEGSLAQTITVRCGRKDGSIAWMEARAARLKATSSAQTMIVLTLRDVTAQRAQEQRTQASLREKEVLLREVYHRVKNNLQVIQSLLKMRARSLPAGETRMAIESTVQRVHAMALVHERLYQVEDLARVSLTGYLRDLFDGVVASSSRQPGQVHLELDAEEIHLTLDGAIPFGLLINELLSNNLKHAFPGNRQGTIAVSIHRVEGAVKMVVQDDGVGLPENFNAAACPSMGMKLAASLAHQLGGKLAFTSDHGCRVETNLSRL
jgi:two-component system response regulator